MTDVRTAPYAAEEKRGYRTAKRVFDILLSFSLGILSLIPMGILAAVIVCKDGGNPFYGQSRVGQNGQEFRLIKLRSMKKGADRLGDVLDERQLQEYQKEYKLDDDPRLIGWKKPGDGSRCFGAARWMSFRRSCSMSFLRGKCRWLVQDPFFGRNWRSTTRARSRSFYCL